MDKYAYWTRYYQRYVESQRVYFFEKKDFKSFFSRLKEDVVFFVVWALNAILQVRAYGTAIRKEYGISFFEQWKRLMYTRFVRRAPSEHFRTRLLFKNENWKMVDDFIFSHHHVLTQFAELTVPEEKSIIEDKFGFYAYCKKKDLKTPDVFAVYERGKEIFCNYDENTLKRDLFLKEKAGGKGKGSQKFKFYDGVYTDKEGTVYSVESLKNHFETVSKKNGTIIIQQALINHSLWMKYTSGSLATCRLVSARLPDDGNIVPMFNCLKLPVGNSDADNYALGSIIAPVDPKTGTLGLGVASKPIQGKFEFTHHPDTNQPIYGSVLPKWQELTEFVVQLHTHFQTIFVGWDVSLTTTGFQVVEGNILWSSGSYEIPFQDSLKHTIYPTLFEQWMEKLDAE